MEKKAPLLTQEIDTLPHALQLVSLAGRPIVTLNEAGVMIRSDNTYTRFSIGELALTHAGKVVANLLVNTNGAILKTGLAVDVKNGTLKQDETNPQFYFVASSE